MPCPRFERQGTAESFGRAPACFTERVKKRGHRLPGVRNNRLLEQVVCFFKPKTRGLFDRPLNPFGHMCVLIDEKDRG